MPIRLPSIKTLTAVFDDPKRAREILKMTRSQLLELDVCKKRDAECYTAPKTYDLRLTALNSLDSGLFGVEAIKSTNDEYADYLNTGDSYALTLIRFRGKYRVQSVGDFIENLSRQGVQFS